MKRYTTIHPLFMSFYSGSLYRDVGSNWKKISFLYLFLLLAVCLIPEMFQIRSQISDYLRDEAPKIVRQVPVITITKGKVSLDEQMPYVIKDPGTNTPLIIIDTTGRVTSLKGSEAVALLTDSKLLVRRGPGETRAADLSGIDSLVIDQSKLYDWSDIIIDNFAIVLYPLALIFSFLFRTAQVLIFAAIGMLFAKNLKIPLPFQAMISLAIVAMTPSIILTTIYQFTGLKVPFWWLISFAVSIGYLFFAVKANSEQAPAEGHSK